MKTLRLLLLCLSVASTVSAACRTTTMTAATQPLPRYFICDLESERNALTGLNEGDLAYAKDTDSFAKATGSATWAAVGGGGGVPAGASTELQYRGGATTFGAIAGSAWDGTWLTAPKTTIKTGNALFYKHDGSLSPNFGGYNFGCVYNGGPWNNGGASGTDAYIDDVWSCGINMSDTVLSPADPTKYSAQFTMESKFWNGSTYGAEIHLQTVDTAAGTHRPITMFLPHDGSAANEAFVLQFNKISWHNHTGAQRIDLVDGAPPYLSLSGGTYLISATNNAPVLSQLNAAGSSYLNLPYLDNSNRVHIQPPVYFENATNAASGYAAQGMETYGSFSMHARVFMDAPTAATGTPHTLCWNAANLEITKNPTTNCVVSSRHAKLAIADATMNAVALVQQLRPTQFAYKDAPERLRWGFIAEELQDVEPKLADAYNAEHQAGSLDMPALLALAVKAIQEQQQQIEALQRALAAR